MVSFIDTETVIVGGIIPNVRAKLALNSIWEKKQVTLHECNYIYPYHKKQRYNVLQMLKTL